MAIMAVHGLVSGKVQGVYYRQSTREEAERLGLAGWVRNLADGRVELFAEGEEAAVRELARWLEQGPAGAQVTGVELAEKAVLGLDSFTIER
jgi:acylphosphatase